LEEGLELRHLRYFVVLSEVLHFTRAAERLRITQSTLSHQIRQLEEETGAALFNRSGRDVQLSPAGRTFLPYAISILRDTDAALAAVSDVNALRKGVLRLGVIHTLMMSYVVPVLGDFVRHYPGVKVTVNEATTSDIETGLIDGSFDLGIAVSPPGSTKLESSHLFHEEYRLVASRGHSLAAREAVAWEELGQYKFVMLPNTFATRRVVDAHLLENRIELDLCAECNSLQSTLSLIEMSDFVSVLPESTIFDARKVVSLPIRPASLRRSCAIFWLRSDQRSVAATRFADALAASLAREATRS
jgi:LysR family transcriptional regulator, cyn operon transcriptional activator